MTYKISDATSALINLRYHIEQMLEAVPIGGWASPNFEKCAEQRRHYSSELEHINIAIRAMEKVAEIESGIFNANVKHGGADAVVDCTDNMSVFESMPDLIAAHPELEKEAKEAEEAFRGPIGTLEETRVWARQTTKSLLGGHKNGYWTEAQAENMMVGLIMYVAERGIKK